MKACLSERTLCSAFEAGGVPMHSSHCAHRPQAVFIFAPSLFRFIHSSASLVPFCGLYVVWEWKCNAFKPSVAGLLLAVSV